ncbi:F-box protein SNE [Typha latifolia]|uniref:F-box protein SNE n=1 Tax=Typha latifolia TaxID=4733 RepID=UPI003C2F3E1F
MDDEEERERSLRGFSINDNVDLLVEILSRLDGRSLGVAACVCRLWTTVCRRDTVWEALCDRHVAGGAGGPGTRSVVAALGGYRRLYRLCVGPALDRLGRSGWTGTEADRAHVSLSLSLSLSLFSIDCYERLGGRERPASLLFLCKPVNVS